MSLVFPIITSIFLNFNSAYYFIFLHIHIFYPLSTRVHTVLLYCLANMKIPLSLSVNQLRENKYCSPFRRKNYHISIYINFNILESLLIFNMHTYSWPTNFLNFVFFFHPLLSSKGKINVLSIYSIIYLFIHLFLYLFSLFYGAFFFVFLFLS